MAGDAEDRGGLLGTVAARERVSLAVVGGREERRAHRAAWSRSSIEVWKAATWTSAISPSAEAGMKSPSTLMDELKICEVAVGMKWRVSLALLALSQRDTPSPTSPASPQTHPSNSSTRPSPPPTSSSTPYSPPQPSPTSSSPPPHVPTPPHTAH